MTSLCFSLQKKTSSVSDCSVQSRWDDQTCITSCASICNSTNQDFTCPEGLIYFYKLWIDKFVEIREKLTVLIPGLYSVCKGTVYLLKKVPITIVAIGQTTLFTVALQMMEQILLPDLRRSYKIQMLMCSEQTVFIKTYFITAMNCFFGVVSWLTKSFRLRLRCHHWWRSPVLLLPSLSALGNLVD